MAETKIAFMGDIVGKPGRQAFAHAVPILKEKWGVRTVIVNGENARHGSGLHPDGYKELREAGANIVTLGDHAMDDTRVLKLATSPDEPLCAPVNLTNLRSEFPNVNKWVKLGDLPIYVLTVCGRVTMSRPSADPFAAVDQCVKDLTQEHPDAKLIVEIHAEATSEKMGMAWYCAHHHRGAVLAVVGTHTHVQTNDARLVGGVIGSGPAEPTVAALSDLGMCGGHGGVIGFDPEISTNRLIKQTGGKLVPCEENIIATGAVLTLDYRAGKATGIEAVRIPLSG